MTIDLFGHDVNVVLLDNMPLDVREHVWKNNDDSFTLALNAKYDSETLKKSFEHAVSHIKNGDFEKEDVEQIELEAHGLKAPQEKPRQEEAHAQTPAPAPEPVIPEWLLRLLVDTCVQAYMMGLSSRPVRSRYASDYYGSEEEVMHSNESHWLYGE